ncbi:MAG TPA: hypothetical protein DHV52_04960 [Parachlamydiales bacterium]|nr:MAG: hypothetical protein A2098_03890 [Chlamydiae bacterium GWF2_49_8]HCJ83656.1 hypothetical protein [Parachlamydiales bacterium]
MSPVPLMPSVTAQGNSPTFICCVGQGAHVVVVNQRFEPKKETLFSRLFGSCCSSEKKKQEEKEAKEAREAAEMNVVLSFEACARAEGKEDSQERARGEALQLLEECDSEWQKKKEEGIPLRLETLRSISLLKRRQSEKKIQEVAHTIRQQKPPVRRSLPRQLTAFFSAPPPKREVRDFLPDVIEAIVAKSHIPPQDLINDVRVQLQALGHPLSDEWISTLIEHAVEQKPKRPYSETTLQLFDALFQVAEAQANC